MTELVEVLTRAIEVNVDVELSKLLQHTLRLATLQDQENQRLAQIINDIRERDASKNCLCRGMSK